MGHVLALAGLAVFFLVLVVFNPAPRSRRRRRRPWL